MHHLNKIEGIQNLSENFRKKNHNSRKKSNNLYEWKMCEWGVLCVIPFTVK